MLICTRKTDANGKKVRVKAVTGVANAKFAYAFVLALGFSIPGVNNYCLLRNFYRLIGLVLMLNVLLLLNLYCLKGSLMIFLCILHQNLNVNILKSNRFGPKIFCTVICVKILHQKMQKNGSFFDRQPEKIGKAND